MQRVRHANRGRLLLRTPGPALFGTCICSTCWDQRHQIPIRPYTSLWPHYRTSHFTESDISPDIGFHRASATGVACRQGTLTPPDTWSCPTLGLACVLMSRPISPELVLSPDFWISNIPRYFSFACYIKSMKKTMSENWSKSRQKLSFQILSKLQIWIINYEHHWDIFSFFNP